ncbi:aspartyl protease family protein [Bacteroidota bacterium]
MKQKSILSFLVVLLMVTNLAISQKNIEVPFYTKGPLMYVDVELGGKYCTFLFDTGASSSIISIAFAKELGVNLDKETNVRSFGGVQKAYDVVIPELKLGAYIRQNVKAMAIPNITSGQGGYVGVIGAEFINNMVLSIDYERSVMIFGSKVKVDKKNSVKIPIIFGGGLPLIDVRLQDDKQHYILGKMIVDTGADAYLLFNSDAEKKYAYTKSFNKKLEEITYSPAGQFSTIVGRAAVFGMGTIDVKGVPIKVISPNEQTRDMRNDILGFIGNKLLCRYHITFDGIKNQLYLTPNSSADTPTHANLVGFRFMLNRDRNFVLMQVVENGTAANAGLMNGDVITMIDGRKASETNIDEFLYLFSEVGNEIEILYTRNNKVQQTTMLVGDVL